MTWVDSLPVLTGLLYLAAAWGYYRQGVFGLSLAYTAYAVANIGLILAAVEVRK